MPDPALLAAALLALPWPWHSAAADEPVAAKAADAGVPRSPLADGAGGAATPPGWEWLAGVRVDVFGNLLGRKDSKRLLDDEGRDVDDRIRLREVSVDVRAPITEWAEAVVLASQRADPVNDFEAEIQEGYVELRGMPLLGSWTRPFELRAGRFRSSFGRANGWRLFELPWPTRSLSTETFLGENGFVQTGFAATLDAPLGSEDHEVRLTLEMLDGGDLPVTETSGDEAFAYTLDLDWLWTPGERSTVLVGASGYEGKQTGEASRRSRLWGVDALYGRETREPGAPGAFHVGAELVGARIERDGGPDDRPAGGYAWGQVRVHPAWYVGLRYDHVEELDDDSLETDRAGGYVTWAPAPGLRFAVGWEHTESDVRIRDSADAVLLEANFAFGSGPRRPFWTGG